MPSPLVVLLCFDHLELFESLNHRSLRALEQKSDLRKVTTPSDALYYLGGPTRPHAVLIGDGAVAGVEEQTVLHKLIEYAKAGGTVVYMGCFSTLTGVEGRNYTFKAWGLSWESGDYRHDTWTANPRVKGLNVGELATMYKVKAVNASNVNVDCALYLDAARIKRMSKGKGKAQDVHHERCETPVAFTAIEKGYLGYVGDVNYAKNTMAAVLAMIFRAESQSQSSQATTSANGLTPTSSPSAARGNASKPKVLIISLEKQSYTNGIHVQLYRALRKNASVTETLDTYSAVKVLSSNPRPSAVIVSDAAITQQAHSALVRRLVEYTRTGGRVVLGMQFSNTLPDDRGHAFFRAWGLNWNRGSYFRTTFSRNPAGVPTPLAADALFPSFSMKAVHIVRAPRQNAVYVATHASRLESYVDPPTPVLGANTTEEYPAVFARVGAGFLGYVGDVNAEQGATRLILEMCGVQIRPGDLGSVTVTTGLQVLPNGSREPITRDDKEIPLGALLSAFPPVPAPPRSDGEQDLSGFVHARSSNHVKKTPAPHSRKDARVRSGSSSASGSGPTPASAPTPPSPARSLPRPREAEVIARAARRAQVREQKTKCADALKEEGNAFFKKEQWVEAAEKYRAAAMVTGPRPVYMANLAAALLKLKQWDLVDSAASRALMHDPIHIKALFRRALSRKELRRFIGAERDLQRVLALDPSNGPARAELEVVRAWKREVPNADYPADEEPEDVVELEDESDSEDFKHKGNNTPCKYYNHDGCRHGARCHFRHAPDRKSVRDELGRNVCIYWLFGDCRFGTSKCVYAHDRTYLAERGWWADTRRNATVLSTSKKLLKTVPRRHLPKAFLADAIKPGTWRNDDWVALRYDVGEEIVFRDDYWEAGPEESDDEDNDNDDWLERSMYGGHSKALYEEMLLQGIKPWEVESYEELAAIEGALFDRY
ncbi:hypothetical protein C8Q79DRAFT_1014122 [Trametes meyenii]|nr:hypothetical protein C8Q79DRAFT_1014122 [Trametes meyenii]